MSHAAATSSNNPASSSEAPRYELKSDLARMCLPAEFKDSYRTLAYVNSICFLFLLVGLVGLKAPEIYVRPLSTVMEPVPVILNEPPPVVIKEEPKPEEFTPPQDLPLEQPQVAVVAAVADPSTVEFAVPVEGVTAIAPTARLATPPPPGNVAPPPTRQQGPIRFNPASEAGSFPPPQYPAVALRNRYQGETMIAFEVSESGQIENAKVQKSSGYPVLDNAALEVVKTRWRFVPNGERRTYVWRCTFDLK